MPTKSLKSTGGLEHHLRHVLPPNAAIHFVCTSVCRCGRVCEEPYIPGESHCVFGLSAADRPDTDPCLHPDEPLHPVTTVDRRGTNNPIRGERWERGRVVFPGISADFSGKKNVAYADPLCSQKYPSSLIPKDVREEKS